MSSPELGMGSVGSQGSRALVSPDGSVTIVETATEVELTTLGPGGTSIEGLSGAVTLTSPDGSITVGTAGQAITVVASVAGPPSAPGVVILRQLPFAFNTPNLATGAPLYTPQVGEKLIDGWIQVDTAWDGTTPRGDFGLFALGKPGLLAYTASTTGLTLAECLQDMTAVVTDMGCGMSIDPAGNNDLAALASYGLAQQIVPSSFTAISPVGVCVSKTGAAGGGSPGSTKGVAVLCLITAIPVAS